MALESTLIAHGLPYPYNLEVAREAEAAVRRQDAIPATVAILGGRVKVGLKEKELEFLATGPSAGKAVVKSSLRDLSIVVGRGLAGATTAGATVFIAARLGIKVMATGGIGGVHRGFGETLDISADLEALSRYPVTVVSSGVKSILDVGATLEQLETRGVSVVGWRTSRFPGFFVRETGFPVDWRAENLTQVVNIIRAREALKLPGATLVVNPVPEKHAMDSAQLDKALAAALAEAATEGIRGKELTPFLLDRVRDLTDNKSLDANLALIRNNAVLAGRLAAALASGDSG